MGSPTLFLFSSPGRRPAHFPPQDIFWSFRRGGACPSRRVLEFFQSTLGLRHAGRRAESSRPTDVIVRGRRAATEARPSPVAGRFPVHPVGEGLAPPAGFWNGLVRRAPTRIPCHGWPEPGAAVKSYQPKFCTAPGPSGPEKSKPGIVFCAPELLRKGVGVSPVNGVRGARLWAGTPIGAHPRRRFGSFFAAEKGTRPKGENLQGAARRVVAPYGCHEPRRAGGSGDPPLQRLRRNTTKPEDRRASVPPLRRFRQITAERDSGRGKPLPCGMTGKHPAAKAGTVRR